MKKQRKKTFLFAVMFALGVFFTVPSVMAETLGEADLLAGQMKFDLGTGIAADGFTAVSPECEYETQANGLKYGLVNITKDSAMNDFRFDGFTDELVTHPAAGIRQSDQAQNRTFIEADYSQYDAETIQTMGDGVMPVRFSVEAEPHRYYTVTATVVNTSDTENAEVSLFSETRRFILHNYTLAPGEEITKTWNVNLEGQYYNATGAYENTALNISVAGKNTGLASVEITKHENMGKTIWLCTDSTGDDHSAQLPYFGLRNLCGVGQALPLYINPEIAVSNQGEGGLTSGDTAHLNNALQYMQSGDYLYVQYGFNGETTESLLRNLPRYYNAAHEKGAKLIVVSTTERHSSGFWNGDSNTWTASNAAMAEAGKKFVEDMIENGANDIAFIDLNTAMNKWMNTVGETVAQQRLKAGLEDASVSRMAMDYYYCCDRRTGVDSIHINDAGADNAAWLVMDEARKTVAAAGITPEKQIVKITAAYTAEGRLEGVNTETILASQVTEMENTPLLKTFYWESLETMRPYIASQPKEKDRKLLVQANVLLELTKNMPEAVPYAISDKIVARGWAPNESYPYPLADEVEYEYPTIVKSVQIKDNAVAAMKTMVQGSMQYYAQGACDLMDADGNVIKTVYSVSTDINPAIDHIDNTACVYGEEYMLYFDTDESNIPAGGAYRVYMAALESGASSPLNERYSSYYCAPEQVKQKLITAENSETAEKFEYTPGSSIVGTNGWNYAGSSTMAGKDAAIKDGRTAVNITNNGSGTFSLYKKFNNNAAVSNGKVKMNFMIYYLYGTFDIKLTTAAKVSSYVPGLKVVNVSGNTITAADGTEIGKIKTGKWTDIECILDLVNGTETVSIAGGTPVVCGVEDLKSSDITKTEDILPMRGFDIAYTATGSTIPSYSFEAYITELSVSELKTDIPRYTVTAGVTEDSKDYGSVSGDGEYDINTTVTLTSLPEQGYECIGWYNAEGARVCDEAEYSFRLREDTNVYAKFAKSSVLESITSFNEDFEKDANIFAVSPNTNQSSYDGTASGANIQPGKTLIDTSVKSGSIFGRILGLSGGGAVSATLDVPVILTPEQTFELDYDCFYGYQGGSNTAGVQLIDSTGRILVGYTWNTKTSNITSVTIGGNALAGFEPFRFKSKSSDAAGADGWSTSKRFNLINAAYTPHVTISVKGDGTASIRFVASTEQIDQVYTGTLEGTVDISALQLSASSNLPAANAVGYDHFVQRIY